MRKLLLSIVIVLSLSACNKEPADVVNVPAKSGVPAESDTNASFELSLKNMTGEQLYALLQTAAKQGDLEKVRMLIKHGADVNLADEVNGQTALMQAAERGSAESVELLLKAGANVNARDKHGQTALMKIFQEDYSNNVPGFDYTKVRNLLLEKGADINIADKTGITALMRASYVGDVENVKKFLELGVDVNAKDTKGDTALVWACIGMDSVGEDDEKNKNQIVEMLLTAGADHKGEALIAAMENFPLIVQTLLAAGADVNLADEVNGQTALMQAAERGSAESVKLLLKAGADVNAKDKNGKTALLQTHAYYDDEIVQVLLNAGADINVVDNRGDNALIYASKYGNANAVQLLLNKGIKVTQEDKDRALRLACPEANIEVVEVLLAAGANVNGKDKNGKTALMYTTPYGYYEENLSKKVMEKLIAAGGDVNAVDNEGKTALMGVVSEFTDGDMGGRDQLELMDTLIANGANVNAADKNGKTTLMYMTNTFDNYTSAVAKLLKAGADVNAVDNKGRTVLLDFIGKLEERKDILSDEAEMVGEKDYPNIKEFMDYLRTLIKAGANVNAKDNNGSTALIYATRAKSGNYEGIVNVLLEEGADVNVKDKDGNTALKLAQEAGNEQIIELLKQAGAKEQSI